MINVNHSARATAAAQNAEQNRPTTTYSAAPTVIELFQKRLRKSDELCAPAQAGEALSHTQQRIEALLRHAATEGQPSLAAEIHQLVQNAPDPLNDSTLHSEVERRLNQPSALNSQKTYAQLIGEIINNTRPSATSVTTLLSRGRRGLHPPAPAQDTRNGATRQFADALVNNGDQQLAINYANHLIRMWVYPGSNSFGGEQIAVPPGSTFGLAWTELGDALSAEPFKTFAKTQAIDISSLVIQSNGDLTGVADYRSVSFSLAQDPDWATASSAVLAAAKKIPWGDIRFQDRAHAPAQYIADFYGERSSRFNNDDRLFNIEQLSKGSFGSLGNTDSYYESRYAPFQQRQKDAKQKITNLPGHQLNQLVEHFAPATAAQKVKDADNALAQLCSQALAQDFAPTIEEIPEYSTFNQARENLKQALSGSGFAAFAQENNLELSSVRIYPSDGALYGNVNGVQTVFSVNDVSGWSAVWPQVQDAARRMASRENGYVDYPSTASATLAEVLGFYDEVVPRSYFPEDGWRRKGQNERLRRSAEITQNGGFKALADTSSSARQAQDYVTRQLAGKPLTLSTLETLAATVKTSLENVEPRALNTQSPEDAMASAESALAVAVQRAMLELKNDPTDASSKLIDVIPANTQFGQWWAHLGKALNGRGLTEWTQKQGIDPATLQYDPADNVLIGKVNGADQRFDVANFATTYPDQFDAISYVVTAAEALVPNGKPILLSHANGRSAPFEYVANFYGIDISNYNSPAFANTADLIGRTQRFPERVDVPAQRLNWLNRQKAALGDSNDRYTLINTLKGPDYAVDGRKPYRVDPDSSHQPKGPTTRDTFIADQGWYPVSSLAQTQNLLLALQTPVPLTPALGNRWGFLSTELALSTEQRSTVAAHVKSSIGDFATLISYLSVDVNDLSTDPNQALDQLLSSEKGLALAQVLQTRLKGAATATSLKQWLLTALVLDLDPTAGTLRNTAAGFDFMQPANWGLGCEKIRARFNRHLTTDKKIPTSLAPIAQQLLMSGMAPQLLVKEVPPAITLGSPEWVIFTTAVNRIELNAPGATANMTYQQVMDFQKIKPISARETTLLAIAQHNPLMDWAVINNHVVKHDKDEYTLEQLSSTREKLATQIQETSNARQYLSQIQPPNRRSMALEALRAKFGNDIDFESNFMLESVGPFSNTRASIVEIYEAGRLGEHWRSERPGVNVDDLRNRAHELPVINETFDSAIREDHALRRSHLVSLFKDLLSKLPLSERNSMNFGDVWFNRVSSNDTTNGLIIRSEFKGIETTLAVYPAAGILQSIPHYPANTTYGETANLTLDAQAFKTGAVPKAGVQSEVTLEQLPAIINDKTPDDDGNETDEHHDVQFHKRREQYATAISPTYEGLDIGMLAEALVDSYYLPKKHFISTHRTAFSNAVETGKEPSTYFKDFLRTLPGVSSLEDLYHGDVLGAARDLAVDVAIYMATEGVGKLWQVAKTGAAWTAATTSAKYIQLFGTETLETIALKDTTAASTSQSFRAVNRLQGSHWAEPTARQVIPQGNIANGTVMDASAQQTLKVTAVRQGGEWYAYDTKTMSASGPALSGFRSDTTLALTREILPNGSTVLVPERLFREDAVVINRATHTDVRIGDKVYRYDPKAPEVLTDLESADRFNEAQEIEAFCSAAPRIKRALNDVCFTKVVSDLSANTAKLVQGLEHMRLYPSPASAGKSSTLVYERRLFDVMEKEGLYTTTQRSLSRPIEYLPSTRGTLIKDPHFGLPGTYTLPNLEQNTRIVKLGAISRLSNDQRELRGTIALQQMATGATHRYVVVEADSLTFYYSPFDAHSTVLNFKKVGEPPSMLEKALVDKHIQENEGFLRLAGARLNNEFIALPSLDSAFSTLEASGYTRAQVGELKTTIAPFSDEKKREFVYQLTNRMKNANAPVVLKSTTIVALEKADNFAHLTTDQQNKFYAEGAKKSVDSQFKATGIGSTNKRTPHNPDDRYREGVADTLVDWMRSTHRSASESAKAVLKFGAGNCGEMAETATQVIKRSGGRAESWHVNGGDHVFTLVGGPTCAGQSTVDFSQAEWKDAWIVDPWADISCKASEYIGLLKDKMSEWSAKGLQIYTSGGWRIPSYPRWITELTTLDKRPL